MQTPKKTPEEIDDACRFIINLLRNIDYNDPASLPLAAKTALELLDEVLPDDEAEDVCNN